MGLGEASTSCSRVYRAFYLPQGSFWNHPKTMLQLWHRSCSWPEQVFTSFPPPPPPAPEVSLSLQPSQPRGHWAQPEPPPSLLSELLPGILTFPKPLGEAPPRLI